ncbi:TIGR00282 family metallophosphoesterase [Fodinicurvata halophila]|uniref:TIGR00282 family metallophosphoesterase n=1 Tax=Fodinicurvata halophila TaxID=1419723 RepID=A0ABV8UJB0_9PROT
MKLLFCGDIVGRSGREIVHAELPRLRRDMNLDFVVINAENAAGGFGMTEKICAELFELGADVLTGGNHSWDKSECLEYINREPRLLRPANYPSGTPGRGIGVYSTLKGQKVAVMNVMGRLFMDPLDDPFATVTRELERYRLKGNVDAFILDVHAEASSEKMAMGHFVDGRVSLAVGTHTHVPTADAQILPGGTAYQTDAGMCGDYNSVIGMNKDAPIARFSRKLPTERLSVAHGPADLCAVFVETDDATGLAKRIEPIRMGARLKPAAP